MPTGTLIGDNRAWTYHWTRPNAVKIGTDTYFTGVGESGDWYCGKNDSSHIAHLYSGYEQDDHNNPSVCQVGNKVFSFFTRHGKSVYVNYCSADVGDINFGTKSAMTFSRTTTYSQPVCYSDDVWVFTRTAAVYWTFRHSGDQGATWDSEIDLLYGGANNKIYMTQAPSSTSGIHHVAAYGHPSESTLTDIYYFKINFNNGDILDQSDNVIANLDGTNLPLDITSLDVAWSPGSDPANPRVRLYDVGEKQGKPIILYGKWNDNTSTPQYYYSYLDTTWTSTKIETSGGIFLNGNRKYGGGMSVSQNTSDNYLYLSKYDTSDSLWKVRRFVVNSDMSVTYNSTKDESSAILARPVSPLNGDGVMYVQYTDYTFYTNFQSKILWKT